MQRTKSIAGLLGLALTLTALTPSGAAEFNVAQGQRAARTYCANCHSVERNGASPMPIALPFRVLAIRLSDQRLSELVLTHFDTAHPTMPRFVLDADQLTDLGAYLQSLR